MSEIEIMAWGALGGIMVHLFSFVLLLFWVMIADRRQKSPRPFDQERD